MGKEVKSGMREKGKRKSQAVREQNAFIIPIRGHLQSARTLSAYAKFSVVTYLIDVSLAALEEADFPPQAADSSVSIVPRIKEMAAALSSGYSSPGRKAKQLPTV